MKRAVVFAHYDIDAIIDDYVIFYLKELKKTIEKVVFVSSNRLGETEVEKLKSIADIVICEPHDEYDFGSYKRGFDVIKAEGLSNYEEIIFANDSCYAPIYSVEEVFEQMETKECDFWGITKNNYGIKGKSPHIQTYFIAFRKNVFMSNEFIDFMQSVKAENSKNDIIEKYELGISRMLYANGYKDCSYITAYKNISNCTIKKWRELLLRYKMPFVKCSILRLKNTDYTTADGWREIIEKTGYPVEYIEKNLKRTRETSNKEINLPSKTKEFVYNFLNYLPKDLRKPFISLLKEVFSTVS